jgi:hypothetical protein
VDRLLVLLSLGIVALIVAVPLWHELRHLLGWLRSAPDFAAVPLDVRGGGKVGQWSGAMRALRAE